MGGQLNSPKETIIVAGGRGFIGAHLTAALLRDKLNVISIDSGLFKPASVFLENRTSPHLVDLKIDASDYEALLSSIELHRSPKAIINCVGPARPSYYLENPISTATTLTNVTNSLLKLSVHFGTRYIHASSSETYGNILNDTAGEDNLGRVNTLSLRAAYAEAKRFCETLVISYVHEKRITAIILRLFNAYGPGFSPDDDRVIPAFIHSFLSNKAREIYGSGAQIRSFCFIDDIIRAFTYSIFCKCASLHCLNIGNPEPISILNLAELTGQLLHRKIEIQHANAREDEIEQRVPDISRAQEILGWKPEIMLQEGLKKTLSQYFPSEV
jgi:nucleoside-diphosphate-sugar epimerase